MSGRTKTGLPERATIEGPQMTPRGSPSFGAGIALAQQLATRHGCGGTWIVTDSDGRKAVVTKYPDGLIVTGELEAVS